MLWPRKCSRAIISSSSIVSVMVIGIVTTRRFSIGGVTTGSGSVNRLASSQGGVPMVKTNGFSGFVEASARTRIG